MGALGVMVGCVHVLEFIELVFFINTRKYLCEINMLQLIFKKRFLTIYIILSLRSTLSN